MKSKAVVSAVVAVVAAVAIYFAFFSASDEQKIRDVLARFAKTARVKEDASNPILRLAAIRGELAETVDENVRAKHSRAAFAERRPRRSRGRRHASADGLSHRGG